MPKSIDDRLTKAESELEAAKADLLNAYTEVRNAREKVYEMEMEVRILNTVVQELTLRKMRSTGFNLKEE